MSTIAERYVKVSAQVAEAARRAGRDPREITLIAVSKTKPIEAVREAFDGGARLFGENYVQELVAKADALPEAEWHFIGQLQSNKIRALIGRVACIHSVDREKLVAEISRRSVAAGVTTDVLIEVNIGGEASKSGVAPGDLLPLARAAAAAPGVRLRGLMAIPQAVGDAEDARPAFRALAQLLDDLRGADLRDGPLDMLSMGMSHDFEVAIAEGATHVRVGTAIFGERAYPPQAAERP